MSEASAATPIKTTASTVKVGHVYIAGRIDAVRKFDGRVFTRLALPAADPYSNPDMVEVESKQSIGSSGDDWKGFCRVGGYRNEFHTKDENGDSRLVKSARNTLIVSE